MTKVQLKPPLEWPQQFGTATKLHFRDGLLMEFPEEPYPKDPFPASQHQPPPKTQPTLAFPKQQQPAVDDDDEDDGNTDGFFNVAPLPPQSLAFPSAMTDNTTLATTTKTTGTMMDPPVANQVMINSEEELKHAARTRVQHLIQSVRTQSPDLTQMVFDEYFLQLMTPTGLAVLLNQILALPPDEQPTVMQTCATMAHHYLQLHEEQTKYPTSMIHFDPPLSAEQVASMHRLISVLAASQNT